MKAIIVGAVESTRVALQVTSSAPAWGVAALITLPPQLASRHSDFADLALEAERAGAKVIHAADSNAPAVREAIDRIAADVVFVIGWSQICKSPFLDAARRQVIGYHPAPLPQMRGRAAIPWTILLGQTITASTLFWLDEGIDSGPIFDQRFLHVARDETATSLYQRHLEALEAMLRKGLKVLASGERPRLAQDERYASWTAKRTPKDGLIDWHQPANDIWRLIRAVAKPYPGAFTGSDGEKLTVWQAEPWPPASRHAALPGQVISRKDKSFAVACGDGNGLWISDWETSSGRMPKLHSTLIAV